MGTREGAERSRLDGYQRNLRALLASAKFAFVRHKPFVSLPHAHMLKADIALFENSTSERESLDAGAGLLVTNT